MGEMSVEGKEGTQVIRETFRSRLGSDTCEESENRLGRKSLRLQHSSEKASDRRMGVPEQKLLTRGVSSMEQQLAGFSRQP